MDVLTIIGMAATVVGIIAGIVQVAQYAQDRRKRLDTPAEQAPAAPTPVVAQVPHNLPPRSELIGREAEKARVHEALQSRSRLVSIDGIGGIGKTVLALEVAHECLCASRGKDPTDGIATFDGLIWTSAKDRDLTLNALLDAVARTLDYPGIVQQPVEDKRMAVQKLLQEKPFLLIVDNFETITDEGVRDFLTELPEPCRALITTREQKLRRAWAISLKRLTELEALALMRSDGKRLGLASLERAEDRGLLHLYQATGGAPLAIKWAVGQIKQKGQSLDTVLTALYEARGDIFDNIFARSWDLLSASARQVLVVMPIFATFASRAGIDAASNVHHFALDEALGQLVEMSLVDATDELDLSHRRYSIHPLTRAFATKKGESEPEIQKAAQERLAKFFQSFANKHGGIWNEEGFAQLGPELPNILALTRWCWEQRLPSIGLNIFKSITDFLLIRGHWSEAMELGQQAIVVAANLGDESRTALFRVWPIGWLYRHRGDLNSAKEEVKQALAIFERLDDEEGIALAKRNLGRIFQERGELEQAERLLGEAFALEQSIGCERRIYLLTANLADVALDKGDFDTAWALCDGVLASAHRFGHPESIARLLKALGRVAYQRGDLEQAESSWKEALAYMKRASRRDEMADCRYWLARLEIEAGDELAATELFSKALETYRRLGIQSKSRDVEARLEKLGKPAGYEEGGV